MAQRVEVDADPEELELRLILHRLWWRARVKRLALAEEGRASA